MQGASARSVVGVQTISEGYMTPVPFQDAIADLYLYKRRSGMWIARKYRLTLAEVLAIVDRFNEKPLWRTSN